MVRPKIFGISLRPQSQSGKVSILKYIGAFVLALTSSKTQIQSERVYFVFSGSRSQVNQMRWTKSILILNKM